MDKKVLGNQEKPSTTSSSGPSPVCEEQSDFVSCTEWARFVSKEEMKRSMSRNSEDGEVCQSTISNGEGTIEGSAIKTEEKGFSIEHACSIIVT